MDKNRRVEISNMFFPGAAGRVEVRSPEDLIRNNIGINPEWVANRWGKDAAKAYVEAYASRIRSGESIPASSEIARPSVATIGRRMAIPYADSGFRG